MDKDLASRQEARTLAQAAQAAQLQLRGMDQEKLDAIVQAVSRAFADQALELGRLACQETGFGNEADKAVKNRFASLRVWEGH